MSEAMHVGIENPSGWRKEILSTAIDTIQALKTFEFHKRINKEKSVYRRNFIRVVKELSREIQDLRHMLPLAGEQHPRKEEEKKHEKKVGVKHVKEHVKRTEMDKLESDMRSLKDKIANL